MPTFGLQVPENRNRRAKGKGPLSTPAISRASVKRVPEPVSFKRPDAEETLRIVLASLDDMKAQDIVTLDLRGKTAIGDYMVVASGTSNRHVGSVADNVVKQLKDAGLTGLRIEGQPHCDWVLIDAGDLIVHIFRPEVRDFYGIEKMWAPGQARQKAS